MAKLFYTQLRITGRGRYDLLVSAKIKELIEYYEIESLFIFQREFNEWLNSFPNVNAYHISNAYRFKISDGIGQLYKNFAGSDKEPVLVFEFTESK